MKTYRWTWLVLCTGAGVAGWLAAVAISLEALVAGVLGSAIVGAIVALAFSTTVGPTSDRSHGSVLARGALVGGVVAGAALGLTAVIGVHVFLLGLYLLIGSPRVVERYIGWSESTPTFSTARWRPAATTLAWASPAFVPVDPPELRLISDEELCRRWRASCASVREDASVNGRVEAVAERQGLLDEIERRNPAGFTAWLTSDAPTALTAPPLSGPDTGQHSIDWDALLERED